MHRQPLGQHEAGRQQPQNRTVDLLGGELVAGHLDIVVDEVDGVVDVVLAVLGEVGDAAAVTAKIALTDATMITSRRANSAAVAAWRRRSTSWLIAESFSM